VGGVLNIQRKQRIPMRAFNILLVFGIAVLALFVALIDAFAYFEVPTTIQIGWFTILAEGFGFIGLSLVEITIFLCIKKLRPAMFPNLQ
jgi:hypothetical protein